MKIYIIRHAEPDYKNNTLTEKGFREVEILKERMKNYHFKELYVSTLPRAIYTAKAITSPEPVYCKWLEEFFHEITLDGKKRINWDFLPSYFVTNKDLYNNDTYLDKEPMISGDIKKYYEEVTTEFDKIICKNGYERMDNGNYKVVNGNHDSICFVCHMGMMTVLMSHLLHIPYVTIIQTMMCAPTGITILSTEEREEGIAQFRTIQFGDVSHLENANEPISWSGRFDECYYDENNLGGRIVKKSSGN